MDLDRGSLRLVGRTSGLLVLRGVLLLEAVVDVRGDEADDVTCEVDWGASDGDAAEEATGEDSLNLTDGTAVSVVGPAAVDVQAASRTTAATSADPSPPRRTSNPLMSPRTCRDRQYGGKGLRRTRFPHIRRQVRRTWPNVAFSVESGTHGYSNSKINNPLLALGVQAPLTTMLSLATR